MDYVAAWYMLAAQYIQGTRIKVAFVSTNSITQGEQVGILWQSLLSRYGIHINFAHRTFKWTIDEKKAKGMKIAAVHCIIVGFAAYDAGSKTLFDYENPTAEPHRVETKNINPYLVEAQNVLIPIITNKYANIGIKIKTDRHCEQSEALRGNPANKYKKYGLLTGLLRFRSQ